MPASEMNDRTFAKLAATVYDLSGITVDDSKRSTLSGRIRRRLRAVSAVETIDEYLDHVKGLSKNDDEVAAFVDVVTTHTTSFFRTPSAWDFLKEEFSKEERKRDPVHVWSAASSSGEEPYSVSMLLHFARKGGPAQGNWKVQATDVSRPVVERAKEGLYTAGTAAAIDRLRPEVEAPAFFKCTEEGDRVTPTLAKSIQYGVHNLHDRMHGRFDLVFLRNVIIYFSDVDREKIVRQVIDTIKPNGLLVIGESESLVNSGSNVDFEAPCVYRKRI